MQIEAILTKIQRSHKLCCVFINPLGSPIVTTDDELFNTIPKASIIGFYNYKVQDWMLEEDFIYWGIHDDSY